MTNNKWMDDPVLNGISNEKLESLDDFFKE